MQAFFIDGLFLVLKCSVLSPYNFLSISPLTSVIMELIDLTIVFKVEI